MALIRRFILPDEIIHEPEKQAEKMPAFEPPEEELAITVGTVKDDVPKPVPEKIDPQPEPAAQTPVEEQAAVNTEPIKEEAPEEGKEEKKPKKRTTKAKPKTDVEEEIINVRNTLPKNQDIKDIIASVMPKYTDSAFEEFKENLKDDLKFTTFDKNATSAEIRVVLSRLCKCFDNVSFEYARINGDLESLSNKTYGLITRQISMNSVGANDAERKKNGAYAPEIYKDPSGKTINLYALQALLDREADYLRTIMKMLDYKRQSIISYINTHKLDADILGD